MSIAKFASVAACTPAAMASAGVSLDEAIWFHTRARRQGLAGGTDLTRFQWVRGIVGSHLALV